MLVLVLAAAAILKVDANAGNNKFDATFDAPLGERIMATSSAVGCELALEGGNASGTCSVPLTSVTVDGEPTKTGHFQQWATNKKVDPKACALEARLEGVKLEGPLSTIPVKLEGEAAFKVCGKAREDGGKEKLQGTAVQLPNGSIRIRARVERFDRDKYRIGPRYTDGWLSRVQQLAPVVAEVGTIDISIFARPSAPPSASRQ
ncbi:MAG TPA: hypothetical protein VMK66_00695 [Myxococcales bacterium]|nr:hypothetical protein [Myxococcales bacterium]